MNYVSQECELATPWSDITYANVSTGVHSVMSAGELLLLLMEAGIIKPMGERSPVGLE